MTSYLPPFDPKPPCPKCGDDCASRHWFAGNDQMPECHILICLDCNHVWTVAPIDATDTADDAPEDAYLAGKLAAHTPQIAQKPASEARNTETGIRDHIDQDDAVESHYERLTTCVHEAPSGIGADSEPSIPVSRIVAVLAERIDRWTRNSDGASDSRVFWGDLECRAVANELGFTDALDAELARRKGTA